MTQTTSDEAILKGTGRSWPDWVELLDSLGARDLSHRQIADAVYGHGTSGWWAQGVAVRYEQHIGRRQPGQGNDGAFEVTVSKTLDGSIDDALDWWLAKVKDAKEFSGAEKTKEPEISKTNKWRYWRVDLGDGSKVTVNISEKSADKALFAVTSTKLPSADKAEHWRTYWKEFLAQ